MRWSLIGLAVLAGVLAGVSLRFRPGGDPPARGLVPVPGMPAHFRAVCSRVIDGDTIELAGGERVRYIGIDAPEMRPVQAWAEAATEANRELVEGRGVLLELDAQERDRYGRLLAYVYVDGLFVNAEMVRRGYAQVSTYPPNVRHQDSLLAAEGAARAAGCGLWSPGTAAPGAPLPAAAPTAGE